MRKSSLRKTNEDIKNDIFKALPNAIILDLWRERKQNRTRISVKMKCKTCGIVYTRDFNHIIHNKMGDICGHCCQTETTKKRRERYNNKYTKMMEYMHIKLLHPRDKLYADESVDVESEDGFRFTWKVGRKVNQKWVLFNPTNTKNNSKNFEYNLLHYSQLNGYTCTDIQVIPNDENIVVTCECGNKFTVPYTRFLYNGQFRCQACSIMESKYECIFEEFLKQQNIDYVKQYRISSCKNVKPLPFDFLIKQPRILVEVQGEQHYHPVRFRCFTQNEANEIFKKQQMRDKIKSDFCKEKNIPLLIVSYKDIRNNTFQEKAQNFIQTHTKSV